MKNKICFILPGWVTKQTGGSEWQVYNLSEKFVEKGWQVEVVTLKKKIIYPEYLNSKINYMYYKPAYLKLSRTLAFVALFIKLFKTASYYYYVRTDARMERGAVRLFSKLMNRKYLFALAHDDDLDGSNFKKQANSKYLLKKIISYVDAIIADFLCVNIHITDLTIAQTNFQRNYLYEKNKLNSVVIRNSYFGHYQNDISHKEKWVIWVNNMRKFKRPELYLQLVNKYHDSRFKFLMIGETRSYSKMMENIPGNNFEYLGSKKYKETQEIFSRSKILINTSLNEGFSNTFLEAWANRVWVITLGVDPDTIITNNGFGDVCNTVDEIAVKLKEIEINGLNELKLKEAQDFVKQNYAFEQNFEFLLSELKNLN